MYINCKKGKGEGKHEKTCFYFGGREAYLGFYDGECIVFKSIEQWINQANDECEEFGAY